ncbi:MAG: SIR2 family protein [Planctomycetia bacterium]|uniref:SIR2 family protein n=1 Tax=Candidatus Kuenenia sp. TaxID=2499824 RepID=UPI001DC8AD56|nr:SIR2 family protein [Planctomycetia bacterium]
MRVTAFLGAGAYLEIGGPSTKDLTDLVRKKKQQFLDPFTEQWTEVPFLENIASQLDSYFNSESCNFEDLFHVLEMMGSYFRGRQKHIIGKQYKPPLGAFITLNCSKWLTDKGRDEYILSVSKLITAKKDILEGVAAQIFKFMEDFDSYHKHRWFADFWNDALNKCAWDIATLNYDYSIEKSIRNKIIEDGYEVDGQGSYRFNPRKLIESNSSKVLHLHGCILYGYARHRNPNKYLFEDAFEDIYKFDTYERAKETWLGRSTNNAQSQEEAIVGPIITGLRKTDKLLYYPYNTYHHALQQATMLSPRLLIAGYSFSDLHFNAILERVTRLYGEYRRVVIITYFDKDYWHPDPMVMGWPHDYGMTKFIATVFRESAPFNSHKLQSLLCSKDGCVKLYLCGMKKALENHGDEIIEFLTS